MNDLKKFRFYQLLLNHKNYSSITDRTGTKKPLSKDLPRAFFFFDQELLEPLKFTK